MYDYTLRAFLKNKIKQEKTRKTIVVLFCFIMFYFVFYQAACGKFVHARPQVACMARTFL
jgi:hypothetical protein